MNEDACLYERPWGSFKILTEERNYKVKILTINPNEQISYQYHSMRNEHWVILSGLPIVTINDKETYAFPGDTFNIQRFQKHEVINKTSKPVTILEVQQGNYLGEDDIVRLKDKYNRVTQGVRG